MNRMYSKNRSGNQNEKPLSFVPNAMIFPNITNGKVDSWLVVGCDPFGQVSP